MSDKPHKHEKWEKFKGAMKKAGKWTVKNLLPVAVSMAAGGLGLSTALGGLTTELFTKFSNANIKIPISEDKFKEKLEELCHGEGKVIEYLQEKLEKENEQMLPEDIKLVIEHVMTPVVSEMGTMLEIMKEEKTDVQEILAGWLSEQSQLIKNQTQLIQNEFSQSHEQLYAIENKILNEFQRLDIKQIQILENINEFQSHMQFELSALRRELSELLQAVFGQSAQEAYDLDTMFNLATVHFNHQNLASRFDMSYNPDLYVRPERFFESITTFLSDFRDPMKKNVPIFLLLAHLGMGKTWNFAYLTEYLLIERNIAIPFFINLKDGLQQQLYGIFNTKNMREIAERCEKIRSESQLPIFLILDGLDELTTTDLKDLLLNLKELLNKRSDALCVGLSCRIIPWVEDQQILNERFFFEDHVWANQNCSDWKSQFDIATPISCVLGEFSDFELDIAIKRYGLEKQNFSPGLYELSHQPYILRLVSEFIGLNNYYPEPEEPESMKSLFYSDDHDMEKNTIMYRMGIHGNILDLFSRIITAFPSAHSELSDKEFKKFANDQYFRPILYSGIIMKVWRKMVSVYQINPVYIPLLSLLFPHLSEEKNEDANQGDSGISVITPQTIPAHIEAGKKVNYFLQMANLRRDENNFDAELEALQEAEKIIDEAFDFDLTEQLDDRIEEFEEAKRKREEEERKAKEEAENNKIMEYDGIKIIKKDLELLTELNEILEKDIPTISTIEWDRYGVKISDNRIVGLSLYEKKFPELPDVVCRMTTLEILNLRWIDIKELPESIGNLTSLKDLDLLGNNFEEDLDIIGKLESLEKLNLDNCTINSLPESIGNLKNLKELNLRSTKINELPDSIGELTSLTDLDLGFNELEMLPESIGKLKSLKKLNLRYNKNLNVLPDTIGELTSLVELDSADCQLEGIPESIGNLRNLEELRLNINQIEELPDSIGQLTSLSHLDVSTNLLKEIPESIGNLKNLGALKIYENKLKKLPESIGNLTKIRKLNLENNELDDLPESLGQLSLRYLNLEYNWLKKLSEKAKKALKKLKKEDCTIVGFDI